MLWSRFWSRLCIASGFHTSFSVSSGAMLHGRWSCGWWFEFREPQPPPPANLPPNIPTMCCPLHDQGRPRTTGTRAHVTCVLTRGCKLSTVEACSNKSTCATTSTAHAKRFDLVVKEGSINSEPPWTDPSCGVRMFNPTVRV